jgi:hypothetical protein
LVTIIGHGPFEEYKCEISIKDTRILGELIESLSIPAELKEVLIPVKDSSILDFDYLVNENDEIHLFMQVSGG